MKKLIIATILIGCGSDPPVQNPPQATWSKDIAPLFSRHCVSCHKTGGIAPFSLETHQSAELWADAALEAVRNRVMPPWLITDDGSCQTFEESRWLSDEEIDLIAAWVEGGTVRGDDIAAIELESNDALTGDVLDLIPSEPYVPHGDAANGYPEDDYRCFV